MKRSKRALLADPAAASAAIATATAATLMSGRGDRRRWARSAAPARDQVAVPVETVFRHALERRKVDVDDPEPLRIAERPLEVVEEAPDEVALDGRPGADRTRDRADVGLEEGRTLEIAHVAAVHAHVWERRPVLGDVDGGRLVVARHPNDHVVQAVGVDLPAHVRVLCVRIPDGSGSIRAGGDDEP